MMPDAGCAARRPLVTLVNTNRIRPQVGPIAFDYLHEPLVNAGFRVEVLDLCPTDDWRQALARYTATQRPDCWGVTLRNTDDCYFASREPFHELVRQIISALREASPAPVVMGGVGFSVLPGPLLEHCGADFGIVCEGERSFPALVRALVDELPYGHIPGLVFRDGGEVRVNPPVFADLRAVPAHRRGLIDNPHYFSTGGMAGVETKRGCTRVCVYCVEPLAKGRQVRLRDPSHLADEVEALLAQGVDVFHVNDSEFNLDVQHAMAFCRALLERGLSDRVRWYAYGMPTPFPVELAELMVRAGCAGMNFGVDSGSEKMLRVIRRTFRPHHVARAVETCRQVGLPYMLELLFGFPGETAETVRESIGLMRQIDAELVSVTAGIRIYPGTELERMVRAEGLTSANPSLHGEVEGNENFLLPLYYLSAEIAPDPVAFISECIGDDPRFFPINAATFNYNDNAVLTQAVAEGARGAYWSILARLRGAGACRSAAPLSAAAA